MSSRLNSARSKHKTDSKFNVLSVTELTQLMQSYFSEIEDPRSQRTRAHLLTDILIRRWRTR